MKLRKRILTLLLSASVACLSAWAQENQSYFLHTIEKGQTLYSIAKMYSVSQDDIIRLNPGSADKILAGQTIKIPKGEKSQQGETFHTIQPGETLYRLTVTYGLSAKAITEANPGLSADNFRAGQVILIPKAKATEKEDTTPQTTTPATGIPAAVTSRCKDMHKVKRKETVFSVSRAYGISEQELIAANPELKGGMKKGDFLCIPYPASTKPAKAPEPLTPPTDKELFSKNAEAIQAYSPVKAALLLSFKEDKRMIEYYEGFLMAADSLKRTGVSLDLYVYDCGKGTASLASVLKKPEMKTMNVIFGPMHQEQIKPLSAFAKENGIRLVVPFSQKGEEVFNNPDIYQINTPQSYLYSEVYDHFLRQFPDAQVIFIEPATPDADKADFISGLKRELKRAGISIRTVSESADKEALAAVLNPSKANVFVPTSGSNTILTKVLPQLTLLVREQPEANIHLFGYPEWQTYTRDYLQNFFELDTYFYSSFYTNTLFPAAVRFINAYHKWYGKDLASKYPNYAMLGFDTSFFLLKGLATYGSALEGNLPKMRLTPIQTGFKFERVNNWGGFINKKVFFIHFGKNFELTKLDFE
ncbi:MAG: LysM peptidoglycan-binding domain-containing protein [Mediterranea sp.]|jgi:LysM repeat protein|nr:LysM peptidoglycan-binding domain-containing protein [Mediterranea sp.]